LEDDSRSSTVSRYLIFCVCIYFFASNLAVSEIARDSETGYLPVGLGIAVVAIASIQAVR